MKDENKTITYRCEAGHSTRLLIDGKLATEVAARRAKTKKCEVGIGGGNVCGARLLDEDGK